MRALFPDAFRDYKTLSHAHDAAGALRDETVVCVDGNVLMMAVPMSCRSWEQFINIIFTNIRASLATSLVTVVVFDDPACLTEAKLAEQQKRDNNRKSKEVVSSKDVKTEQVGDNYNQQYIENIDDVRALITDRQSRTSPPLPQLKLHSDVVLSCSSRRSLSCVSTLYESVVLACSMACRANLVFW